MLLESSQVIAFQHFQRREASQLLEFFAVSMRGCGGHVAVAA
jgi:hypothetical protein